MAENTGMFGLSPYQVQQQRNQQTNASALQFAGLDPFAKANYMMGKAGGGMAQIGAGMLGMQDPAVQQAQQRQNLFQGADLQSVEGLNAAAKKFSQAGFHRESMMLGDKAEARRTEIAARQPKPAEYGQYYRQLRALGYSHEEALKASVKVSSAVPGVDSASVIPKYRNQVQQTIQPQLDAVYHASQAVHALSLSKTKSNAIAFQSARVQLASAIANGKLSVREIYAAGADPSLLGSMADKVSEWTSGTATLHTQSQMQATLDAIIMVARKTANQELGVQRKIGLASGHSEKLMDTLLDFPILSSEYNNWDFDDKAQLRNRDSVPKNPGVTGGWGNEFKGDWEEL
jgi:hypothetical protein